MSYGKEQEEVNYVRGMFASISGRYDLMNRLMTFGRDMVWRRFIISIANIPKDARDDQNGKKAGAL